MKLNEKFAFQSLDSALKSSVSNAFRGMQQQSGPSQGMFQQQMPPRAGGGGGECVAFLKLTGATETAAAPQDPTLEIKRLLNTGNLDAAFSSALGTSNLEIVSWLCSQVAPERVFGQHPCPLSPFVATFSWRNSSLRFDDERRGEKARLDSRHVLGYRSSRPRVEVTRATGIDCRLRVFAKIRIEFSEHLAQRKSRRAWSCMWLTVS